MRKSKIRQHTGGLPLFLIHNLSVCFSSVSLRRFAALETVWLVVSFIWKWKSSTARSFVRYFSKLDFSCLTKTNDRTILKPFFRQYQSNPAWSIDERTTSANKQSFFRADLAFRHRPSQRLSVYGLGSTIILSERKVSLMRINYPENKTLLNVSLIESSEVSELCIAE